MSNGTATQPDEVAPHRTEFATTDPDEAQAFIESMYSARPPRFERMDLTSPVAISQVSAGGLSYVDYTMPPDVTLHLDGTDDLSITTLISGGTHAELGKDTERYEVGDSFLGSFPHGDYTVRCRDFRAGIMTVPAAALARATGDLPEHTAQPLRFASLAPASPSAGKQWSRAAAFAREVLDDDQSAASPLILGSVTRLLAATALAVFPNNLLPEHGLTVPAAATPDTVRRAEEFIHTHAAADIDLTEIAAVCGITPRALQYAFKRHHDTTPMRYLRRVRLARAHHDLSEADPSSGVTVTAIAARWGFAHPGRFAAAYRQAYGQPPGTTLRS